ncbi:MAG: ComEC/Rec2 family competence protein, partial [Dehalococcoidia bacterium]|nr:ComEC/Rec2 family competence protein [Dehalococcoidia bacterium]
LLGAAAMFALLGAWRFEGWASEPLPDLARSVGTEVALEGRIDSEPDPGLTTSRYHVRVERVEDGGVWRDTDGRALITVRQTDDLGYGTPVSLSGRLEAPPELEAFDYRAFLARRDVVGTMSFPRVERAGEGPRGSPRALAAEMRLRLERSMQAALPEPAAALGSGIVMGRDGTMPRELTEAFRETGLAHFVAVSGSNIALVTALAFLLFVPLVGRNWATLPATASLVLYVFLAGAEETVVRAAIMALIVLVGFWLGRPRSGLAALAAAAIAMTAAQPRLALEAGFQLSVASTAGLIVFGPWIRYGLAWAAARVGAAGAVPNVLLEVASLSLAAWVAALPIIWVTFGQVSLIGPLVNIPTVPVFAIAFWLSGTAAIAGAVWEPAGWAIGLAAYYPLAFIIWMAEAGASVPRAAVTVPRFGPEAALFATVALGALAWPAYRYLAPRLADREPQRDVVRTVRAAALASGAGALAAAIVAVSAWPAGGPGTLQVTVLDVGQGDAILVTTPNGERVVVDGGPSGIVLARELSDVLPHWQRGIAAVVLTHPDADHVSGLPALLERFDVGQVYDNGQPRETAVFAGYEAAAGTRQTLRRGDVFEVGGVRFEALWPPPGVIEGPRNRWSVVLRVTYGQATILLTGDIEEEAQRALIAMGDIDAHVLKVPHHGASTNADGFFNATGAWVTVISAGEGNRFGHPTDETLVDLEGRAVLRTDVHGRVTIVSDGESITVRAERWVRSFAPAEGEG